MYTCVSPARKTLNEALYHHNVFGQNEIKFWVLKTIISSGPRARTDHMRTVVENIYHDQKMKKKWKFKQNHIQEKRTLISNRMKVNRIRIRSLVPWLATKCWYISASAFSHELSVRVLLPKFHKHVDLSCFNAASVCDLWFYWYKHGIKLILQTFKSRILFSIWSQMFFKGPFF